MSLVDLQPELVERAAARALRSKQSLPNLRFHAGDAGELLASGALPPADVFTGLHACGGLSDLILAHAVASGAGFCVCTCCFMSNRQILLPLAAQPMSTDIVAQLPTVRGAQPARRSMVELESAAQRERPPRDSSADGLGEDMGEEQAQQTVSRDAWLGVAPAEVESLLRVAELQASPENARSAAHTINALRAAAAERSWGSRWGVAAPAAGDSRAQPHGSARALRVEIKCFERKFSPRNFVLVGQPVWDSL